LLAGVQDKEWPGVLAREICRAACHAASGLLIAQNIATAARDCIADRRWSGLSPVGR
jgi:hypothetical protein